MFLLLLKIILLEGKEIKIKYRISKSIYDELKKLAEKRKYIIRYTSYWNFQIPDVLNIQSSQDDEKITEEVLETVTIATDNLVQMRETEGNKISEDLLKRLNIINKKVEEIAKLSTGLIEEYVVKLEERINEILKNQEIDKTRLAQEVVIYADKCSIEEEVTRLNSHISQFKNLLNSNEAIGKKLDFIIQEMNRETNTIGSKANNLEITNGVIDIKTEIENIREQVQNIE